MTNRSETPRPATRSLDLVLIGLAILGLYHLALGVFMVAAPGTFFTEVGPFGVQNDHYIRDVASYHLAIGAVTLTAVRLRSWRLPVLTFLVIQFGLHTANHVVDIGEAEPESIGVADAVGLGIGTVLIAGLLVAALRPGGRPREGEPTKRP